MVSFRRAPDFDRRADMVEATLDCIADHGLQATTVRAVAAGAGVSNGLIRHHFASKDNLIIAAYRRAIEIMTGPALAVLETAGGTPHERFSQFIVASLSGPVTDPRMLALWATFVSQVPVNPVMAGEHRAGYIAYRDAVEALVARTLEAEGRPADAPGCRRLAIAINALIDGLWVEGCLSADEIDETLQIELGLASIESLLGVRLPRPPLNRKET